MPSNLCLARPRVHLLVAEVALPIGAGDQGRRTGSDIVGHAVIWWAADEAELATLAVGPAFRRQGIAGVLLDRLIHEISTQGVRSVFLEVRASNQAALALYLGRGFREVGLRKHYYDHPREDARVLQRRLESEHWGTPH